MAAIIKKAMSVFALIFIVLNAKAQKQPQIQEGSVRAPATIKIDGKLDEWNNKDLSAYNSINKIYYTVSNDDNNLYFTIRGLGTGVANKILNGGLVITISHTVEKKAREKAPDNVRITFPIPIQGKPFSEIMGPIYITTQTDDIKPKQIDSLVAVANTRLNNAMKAIRIVGVKEFPDSVVSVYNTYGIKAATQFININKRQSVYEFAIPLKYLKLDINNPVKFSYNIKLDVPPDDEVIDLNAPAPIIEPQPESSVSAGGPPSPVRNSPMPNANEVFRNNPTDFWGTYTLAKNHN